MRDFTITIRGKAWRVRFVASREVRGAWGTADLPTARRPRIHVYRRQPRRRLVETLLHEVLHAVRPELSEEAVDETARILERALERAGYTLTGDEAWKQTSTRRS